MEKVYLVVGTIWEGGSLETFCHTVVNDYCVHSTMEGARAELYRILEETTATETVVANRNDVQYENISICCDGDGVAIRATNITADPYLSIGNSSFTYMDNNLFTYNENPYDWLIHSNQEITIGKDMPAISVVGPASE